MPIDGLQRWLWVAASLLAAMLSLDRAGAEEDLLRPEDAFRYEASASDDAVVVDWNIAPGYYLYRGRMSYASRTAGIALLEPEYPQGDIKEDEFFGRQEIYHGQTRIRLPYSRLGEDVRSLTLELKVQGCAEAGVCYPPQTWTTEVALDGGGASTSGSDPVSSGEPKSGAAATGQASGAPGESQNLLELLARDPEFGDSQREFLPPDEAFRFDAQMADPYTIRAHWDIADGYYLYRGKFAFASPGADAQLGKPALPAGQREHDESFGDVEVYYGAADVLVPISRATAAAGELELEATYQGCAKDGICYPPITRTALLMIPEARASDGPSAIAATMASGSDGSSGQDRFASVVSGSAIPLMMGIFFVAGLGLAFTPCVLPMVPILSGLIIGQGPALRTARAFTLSLAYVLAMALTYTAAGVVTALLGRNLQAAFQAPVVIVAFSLLFVAFGLAMLGVFELQMPAAIQNRLTALSNRQRSGSVAGVAAMGILSALIVGPCVAAPIAGALVVIGQSGDPLRGGLALFALSLGMGAPLLAFGTSASKLLPKAGLWMDSIKKAFGILMFGVALWFMSRLLPPTATLLGWGALVAFAGILLVMGSRRTPGLAGSLARAFGMGAFVYTALTVVGAAAGGTDPLRPLAGTPIGGERAAELEFRSIKSTDDLDRELSQAAGRYVMLDFYADWCVACKELEKYTFTDSGVQAALRDVVLLRADVTANDEADRALLARFGIYGPPTVAFFGPDGQERKSQRIVGFVAADDFETHVSAVRGRG